MSSDSDMAVIGFLSIFLLIAAVLIFVGYGAGSANGFNSGVESAYTEICKEQHEDWQAVEKCLADRLDKTRE
jgi:hypothetical protein